MRDIMDGHEKLVVISRLAVEVRTKNGKAIALFMKTELESALLEMARLDSIHRIKLRTRADVKDKK